MTTPTREDIQLYVMGLYDGDVAALEEHLAADPAAHALVAEEARFEVLLREAASLATFCPACDDVVAGDRCEACGAAVRAGGYVIERVLVQNAHGRMYVARDVDGRQVALKELAFVQSPGAEALAAFEREARFLRALDHAKIPRFVASFQEGKGVGTRYYVAQELVSGQSLDARLADHWYDEREIVDIARQVLEVLVYLQGLSPMIVHRDIKPANLVRRDDGAIALVDFGAAYDQGATVGTTSIGTFGYMPVEQMAGQVDATTDPYALGASLVHLLTRREPWSFLQEPDWSSINVGEPVRAFLRTLVASDRRDRFRSAAAALEALERASSGEVAAARSPRAPRRLAWRPALLAAAALAVIGGGALAVGLARSRDAREGLMPSATEATTATVTATAPSARPHAPPIAPPPDRLPPGKPIDLQFDKTGATEVFRSLGQACGLNVVVPNSVGFTATVDLRNVPCDQALEVLLESRQLWYRYSPNGNLLRVAPRREIESEDLAARERAHVRAEIGATEDALPEGKHVDLQLESADIGGVLRTLAGAGGVNLVVDDSIGGSVTIFAKDVSWRDALGAVLESHGLWYRYRENGKLLRVAPRRVIDSEDLAALERVNREKREE